jgi:hypothetical protein
MVLTCDIDAGSRWKFVGHEKARDLSNAKPFALSWQEWKKCKVQKNFVSEYNISQNWL